MTEYAPGEPDEWTWPDVYDRDEAGDDCLNCGMCEACIDRSIAAAEEADGWPTCALCPAFIWAAESLLTGLCFGCRSLGPTERL